MIEYFIFGFGLLAVFFTLFSVLFLIKRLRFFKEKSLFRNLSIGLIILVVYLIFVVLESLSAILNFEFFDVTIVYLVLIPLIALVFLISLLVYKEV